jgi:hypothetical protein
MQQLLGDIQCGIFDPVDPVLESSCMSSLHYNTLLADRITPRSRRGPPWAPDR